MRICESRLLAAVFFFLFIECLVNGAVGHQRFLHFYGEPCARLERDFSVYGDALFPRTPLFHTVSLLLFSTPDVYLPKLQRIWVDQILYNSEWKQTITKFSSEWQDLVAYVSKFQALPAHIY